MKKTPATSPEALLSKGRTVDMGPNVKALREPPALKIDIQWADNVAAPQPSEYLIKGIIEPRQTSIWFGPPGNGKTFLLLHLAYAIARGESVFGRRVRQARTLYMALEGRGGIDKRVYAMTKRFECAPFFGRSGTPLELLQSDRQATRVNVEHVEALVAAVREHDIKLVIIDTLNLTLGGADENDNASMGQLLKAAGEVAEATGAHIAFVAHSAKAGIDGGPRGGGAQRGNADLVVSVSGEDTLTASSHAPAGKIKDGAPFKLHFQLKGEELLIDPDGDAMTSCTVEEVDEPSAGSGKRLTENKQGWLSDLVDMFNESGSAAPRKREVKPGLSILTLTREQVREGYRVRGRLVPLETNGALSNAQRAQLHKALNDLKDLGKVGLSSEYIWLVQ